MSKPKRNKNRGLDAHLSLEPLAIVGNPNVTVLAYDVNEVMELPMVEACPVLHVEKTTWFDVRGMDDRALIENVGQHFGMHSLLIEDVLDVFQRPKVDELNDALFVKAAAHSLKVDGFSLQSEQLSFYLRPNALVSFQEDKDDLYPEIRKRIFNNQSRLRQKNADYLLYLLLDTLCDGYFVVLDKYEDQITLIESEVDSNHNMRQKTQIHLMKRELNLLRRSAMPLRDAVMHILRSGHPLIARENELYFRDLYDHLNEIIEECDNFREQLNDLYDLYLSEIGIKTNSIMQVLTIISTIFIPLTFVVGVYGMNFKHMPELDKPWAYPMVMGGMLIVALLMLLYFRRKRWL